MKSSCLASFIILWLTEPECCWNCKAPCRENVHVRLHRLLIIASCALVSLLCGSHLPASHVRRSLEPLQPGVGWWTSRRVFSGLLQPEKEAFSIKALAHWGTAGLLELSHRDSGVLRTGDTCYCLADSLILPEIFSTSCSLTIQAKP